MPSPIIRRRPWRGAGAGRARDRGRSRGDGACARRGGRTRGWEQVGEQVRVRGRGLPACSRSRASQSRASARSCPGLSEAAREPRFIAERDAIGHLLDSGTAAGAVAFCRVCAGGSEGWRRWSFISRCA